MIIGELAKFAFTGTISYGLGIASGGTLVKVLPKTLTTAEKVAVGFGTTLTTSYVATKVGDYYIEEVKGITQLFKKTKEVEEEQ